MNIYKKSGQGFELYTFIRTAGSVIAYIEYWLLKYFQQGYTAVGVMHESMVVLLTGGQTPLHGSR